MLNQKKAAKYGLLEDILKDMESAVVAFSGGVDSTFLLKAASLVLKDKVMAVTARSPIRCREELERAGRIAAGFGVRHMILDFPGLEDKNLANNSIERCYHCKKKLLTRLAEVAGEHGFNHVAEGSNADDDKSFRPGSKAIKELKVRSPLKEAGFSKNDIRTFSKEMGLETWDASPQSCLLTRFPYDEKVSALDLERVGEAERFLAGLGFRQVRVRVYGDLARIEVPLQTIGAAADKGPSEKIIKKLKALGYKYITLDLEGYRTGSMDHGTEAKDRHG
ncbi:MAG: ATP-dependent sacrificial sulfur transferase LarE [Candidatus Omnitrophota bacterium]